MIYQIHKTLVHIDGAIGELDPIIRPGKLDVHTQVQGERFRVDLNLGYGAVFVLIVDVQTQVQGEPEVGIRCCFRVDHCTYNAVQ